MRSTIVRIGCLLISLIAVTAPTINALETETLAPYSQPPLVWESVTDWQADPASRSGQTSATNSDVTLAPGNGLWFVSKGRSYIRLMTDIDGEQLRVLQGGPLGLFHPLPMVQSEDDKTMISQQPLDNRSFIWISNQGKISATVAIQRGQNQAVPFVSNWPDTDVSGVEYFWLRQYPQSALQKYYRLQKEPKTFTVSGPVLLAIDVRQSLLELPPERRDTLTVQVDQSEPQEHLMHFSPQRAHRHFRDGEDILLSLPERVLVSIPEGEHEVHLQNTTPAWFQLRQLPTRRLFASEDDWITGANENAAFLLNRHSLNQSRVKQLVAGSTDSALALAAEPQSFGKPSWAPDVGEEVLFNRYTQNRKLWPTRPLAEKRWQPVTTTLESQARNSDVVDVRETHLPGYQEFFPIQAETAPIELPAPAPRHPTQLTLQLAAATPGTRLSVNASGQSYPLIYEPRISMPAQTRAALPQRQSVEQQLRTHPILAAEAKLILPAGVENVEIQTTQGGGWLNVALREPINLAMTEAEFLNALATHGKQGVARAWRQKTLPDELPRQLWKDGEFLRNWLHARAANFTRTVSPPLYQAPDPIEASKQLSALIESGKFDLAVNYARGILAFGHASPGADAAMKPVQSKAYDFLAAQFDNRASTFSKQTLLAHEYLRTDSPSVALELAEHLLAEGFSGQALRLVHTISQPTLIDEQQKQLYLLGIRSALIGEWHRSFEQLEKAVPQWRQLYSEIPQWREWPLSYDTPVLRQAIYNPELDRFYQRLKVTPDQPVALSIQGPAKIRIGLNLLHTDRSSRLDDMIELTHNGKQYQLPLLNSAVYNTHRLLSDDESWPGSGMPVLLDLGPGEHRLSLKPSQYALLAQWEIAVPELASDQQIVEQQTDPAQCQNDRQQFQSMMEQRLAEETSAVTTLTPDYTLASWAAGNESSSILQPLDCSSQEASAEKREPPGTLLSIDPAAVAANHDDNGSSITSVTGRLSEILNTESYASQPALVAEANWLAHDYPENDRIQSLLARINEQQTWDQEEIIINSAGLQSFNSSGWPPESEFLEDRRELLGVRQQDDEFLVFGRGGEGILVNNREPQRYSLSLRLAKPGYQTVPPVTLEIMLDGKVSQTVTLSQAKPKASVGFSVAKGQHRITLRLSNPTSRHWVLARLRYRPDIVEGGGWTSVVPDSRRYYHAVTREEPFTAYIDQPSWLKFETYDGREWHTQYRYQAQEGEFTLRRAELEGSYIRLFSLRHKPELKRLARLEVAPALTADVAGTHYQLTANPSFALFSDRLQSRPETAGTHGGFASLRQRPDFESTADDNEEFLEAGYRYRYFQNNANIYWQSDVFGRAHGSDSIGVLGGRQWISWRPDRRNWRAGLYASGYWQVSGTDDRQAGSALVEGRFDGYMPLGSNMVWQHDIEGFARWLSEEDGASQAWDNDVFSRYKSDHRYGVNWEESLSFQPYEDTRWISGVGLRTNEDLNPFSPDRFFARLGWQQYYAGTRFDIGAENRWLRADRDRRSARTQTLLDLSATWHGWQVAGKRWELSAGVGYDLDNEQMSAAFAVSWDLPGAKRLRDFRPEQFVFKRRQHIRAANQVHQNLLNYVEE